MRKVRMSVPFLLFENQKWKRRLFRYDCSCVSRFGRTSFWPTAMQFATAFIHDTCPFFSAKGDPPTGSSLPPFAMTEIESKRHWLSEQSIENRRTNIQFLRLIQQKRDVEKSFFECDRYSNTQTLIICDPTPGSPQWTFSYYYYYYHHFSFLLSLLLSLSFSLILSLSLSLSFSCFPICRYEDE